MSIPAPVVFSPVFDGCRGFTSLLGSVGETRRVVKKRVVAGSLMLQGPPGSGGIPKPMPGVDVSREVAASDVSVHFSTIHHPPPVPSVTAFGTTLNENTRPLSGVHETTGLGDSQRRNEVSLVARCIHHASQYLHSPLDFLPFSLLSLSTHHVGPLPAIPLTKDISLFPISQKHVQCHCYHLPTTPFLLLFQGFNSHTRSCPRSCKRQCQSRPHKRRQREKHAFSTKRPTLEVVREAEARHEGVRTFKQSRPRRVIITFISSGI